MRSSADELASFLGGRLARDLISLPASAFDQALVTDVYKPRMHQVKVARIAGGWWQLLQPSPLHWLPACSNA
jgi:hypothetical protein